ncbi:MAG: nuclear transport factor 2 family protein [Comamonadaceae bacterium]|nr:MAG: nuclear transport factor 2 family protein [Comamonadaceae bacterium]
MTFDRPDCESAVQELLTHKHITEALYRAARGVDRLDGDLIRSAYHPGALDHHGYVDGTVEDFIEWLENVHAETIISCVHDLHNILIDIRGDTAYSETYVLVYQRVVDEENVKDKVAHGRYLDVFEHKHGEWKIAERTVILDWNRLDALGETGAILANDHPQGTRSREDASYRILPDGFALQHLT